MPSSDDGAILLCFSILERIFLFYKWFYFTLLQLKADFTVVKTVAEREVGKRTRESERERERVKKARTFYDDWMFVVAWWRRQSLSNYDFYFYSLLAAIVQIQ